MRPLRAGLIIHVDMMDGHFVPNLTIGPPVVKSLRKATQAAARLSPDDRKSRRVHSGFRGCRGELDFGAPGSLPASGPTLHLIKSHDCLPGVVINPATPVEMFGSARIVDYVLVMSVNPGFGAQKFIPSTLHKMRHLAEIRQAAGV